MYDKTENKNLIGWLDFEADPIQGVRNEFSSSFIGDQSCLDWGIEQGYTDELAIAMICDLLRDKPEAKENAVNFLNKYFEL